MFGRLYRQRRRVLVTATLLLLTALLQALEAEGWYVQARMSFPAETQTFFTFFIPITFLIFAVGTGLVATLAPGFRALCEVIALCGLATQASLMTWPDFFDELSAANMAGILWIGFVVLAFHLTYGKLLDVLPVTLTSRSTRSFVTTATPQAVWNATIPTEDTVETFWNRALEQVEPGLEPGTWEAHFRTGPDTTETQTITFLARRHPCYARYYFELESDARRGGLVDGIYDMHADPRIDGRTDVVLFVQRSGLRPREVLWHWMDDTLGSEADAIRARVEGRRDWSLQGNTWSGANRVA